LKCPDHNVELVKQRLCKFLLTYFLYKSFVGYTLLYCTKTNHIKNDLYIFVHFSIFFLPRLCNFWNSTQFSGFCKLLIRTFYSNLMTRHLFWNILISYSNIYEYSEGLYFFHIQKKTNFCWLEHIFASFFLKQHEIFLEIECGGSNFVGSCIRSWVTDCNLINCVQIIIHLKTEATTFS